MRGLGPLGHETPCFDGIVMQRVWVSEVALAKLVGPDVLVSTPLIAHVRSDKLVPEEVA